MNIKSILPWAITVTVIIAYAYNNTMTVERVQSEQAIIKTAANQQSVKQQMATTKLATDRTPNLRPDAMQASMKPANKAHQIANFDARNNNVVSKPLPTMTSQQSSKVMAEKQAEMDKLVAQYNSALSDPKSKADIERKFRLHMTDYKAALIAKHQNGEL